MKPGVNHIERKGGITDYRWRYYERKIGVYLDLHTPLVAGPDGTTGFTSRLIWEPRHRLYVHRSTFWLAPGSLRRQWVTGPGRHWALDGINLSRQWFHGSGHWKVVADLGDGLERERWVAWPRTENVDSPCDVWRDVKGVDGSFTYGTPLTLDRPAYHASLQAILAGCAERGEFRPLVDWVVENSPETIARLFTEPGAL